MCEKLDVEDGGGVQLDCAENSRNNTGNYVEVSSAEEVVLNSSDIVWSDVNFNVGSKRILHNCWGTVSICPCLS
jgi:hypothetical protein